MSSKKECFYDQKTFAIILCSLFLTEFVWWSLIEFFFIFGLFKFIYHFKDQKFNWLYKYRLCLEAIRKFKIKEAWTFRRTQWWISRIWCIQWVHKRTPMLSTVCNFNPQVYIIFKICKTLVYKETCQWAEYKEISKWKHRSKA